MMYRRFSWFCVRDYDVKHEISGVDLRSCMINYLTTVHAFFLHNHWCTLLNVEKTKNNKGKKELQKGYKERKKDIHKGLVL
mgnify:CR=1 FL=1